MRAFIGGERMKSKTVAIIATPGVQLLDVSGPLDVFAEANVQAGTNTYQPRIFGNVMGAIRSSSGVRLMTDAHSVKVATASFSEFNLEFALPNFPGSLCDLDHPYIDTINGGRVAIADTQIWRWELARVFNKGGGKKILEVNVCHPLPDFGDNHGFRNTQKHWLLITSEIEDLRFYRSATSFPGSERIVCFRLFRAILRSSSDNQTQALF